MVTPSEKARSEPSRSNDFFPSCSPGPKQPQLISSPSEYVRTISAKKAPRSKVVTEVEKRSHNPVSSHKPTASSMKGSK